MIKDEFFAKSDKSEIFPVPLFQVFNSFIIRQVLLKTYKKCPITAM